MLSYVVYILSCSDETLYTGITTDIQRRLVEHNSSEKGAKYTKQRRPVKLVYSEVLETRSLALKREHEIKRFSRKKKMELINVENFY